MTKHFRYRVSTMKNIAYISVILFFCICSCNTDKTSSETPQQTDERESTSQCSFKADAIDMGMEPLDKHNSPTKFINIVKAFKSVDSNYFHIDIEFEEIPDSIEFNNPNISKSYWEYGMDIIFRNIKESVHRDNIVVSLNYNNLKYDNSNSIKAPFKKFIESCDFSTYQVSETLHDDSFGPVKRNELDISHAKIKIQGNWMKIKIPYSIFCEYYKDYFEKGFMIKISHNDAKKPMENNFYTNMVNSDGLIRHNFVFNDARLLEE